MTEKLTDEALEKMAWCDPVAAELLDARRVLEANRRATPADDLRAAAEHLVDALDQHEQNGAFIYPTIKSARDDVKHSLAALAQKGDA